MLNLNPKYCRFFETYDQEEFDEITYTWRQYHGEWNAIDPEWKPADKHFIQVYAS
jgi:hypothetical protein